MSPKVRQMLYSAGVVTFALLTLLSTLRVIDQDVASSVSALVTAVLGVFGVTVSGTAAWAVTKQQHDGTFTRSADPAEQVVAGLNAVVEQANNAQAQMDRVKDAVSAAVKEVPVLGPLAQQALDQLP
jgi:glucan phosphoethanolaminetransferase (alkaline phosphatase superfamily)